MFFGGYERWMLRFWMLHKLDATLLDAGAYLTVFEHTTFFLQGPPFRGNWGPHSEEIGAPFMKGSSINEP